MSQPELANFKDKTILFVDDEEMTREMIERMLSSRVRQVWLAENGVKGLEAFQIHRPDMVITDIQMPEMDGIALLNEIKKIDPTKTVVIITAFEDEAHEAKQADAILIKPVNRRVLFAEMTRLFKRS